MTEIPQDTISFQVRADTLVINDTVKVMVNINTISSTDRDENSLRSDIKAALDRFIPEAKWSFGIMNRTNDATGMERVNLQAFTRVGEKENYKLEDRAKKASIEGLGLSVAQVDSTVPQPKLEEAERQLRLDIITKAKDDCAKMSELIGHKYRIQNIEYQDESDYLSRKSPVNNGTYMLSASSPMGGSAAGDVELTNAQRVSLVASITLALFPLPQA